MADATVVDAARRLLVDAVATGRFPCAVAQVGSSSGIAWREAFGHLSPGADGAPATLDTWFDLASLTKPLATTAIVLDLVSHGTLALDRRVSTLMPEWCGAEREAVTIADLLEHASGLPARLDAPPPSTPAAFAGRIAAIPLAYPPRTQAIYSDLGFILLAVLAEQQSAVAFDDLFHRSLAPIVNRWPDASDIGFAVPAGEIDVAPTRPLPDDPRPAPLVGVVHDNYAAALGGIAGHAGLFGTAAAVASVATALLRAARGQSLDGGAYSAESVQRAIAPSAVPGSSRGLGWDRMLPTSSCGVRMSAAAFGHVGFTGTSMWIDPARDRYYVLLTNRAYGDGTLAEMRDLRRAFHDTLADL